MKLGIKTTGGVSKLKTKTTDGVAKAVECACCDPCTPGPWGPGYDMKPNTVTAFGRVLVRIGKCTWRLGGCFCGDGNGGISYQYKPECGSFQYVGQYDDFVGCMPNNNDYCFIGVPTYDNHPILVIAGQKDPLDYESYTMGETYRYIKGSGEFPYGVYDNGVGGLGTITIS